jgi:multiple sugar transport system substrate-binding protein
MTPVGAEAADLVVWWEQGFYPEEDKAVQETIAAFEHKTGKQVELVFHDQADLPDKVQAAIEAGQPPDFLFGLQIDPRVDPWAYDGRLVDLTEAIGPLTSMFDPDVLQASMLLNGRTGERALYALPIGRSTNHLHVWTSLLEQAGFTLDDIPKEWDAFWSFWCDRIQPAVRQAMGRQDIWAVGLTMSLDSPGETWVQFTQFKYAYDAYWGETADGRSRVADPTARDTDPAARASLIKALDGYRRSSERTAPRPTRPAGPKARPPTTTRPSSRRGSS